jgi:hypothetical protein
LKFSLIVLDRLKAEDELRFLLDKLKGDDSSRNDLDLLVTGDLIGDELFEETLEYSNSESSISSTSTLNNDLPNKLSSLATFPTSSTPTQAESNDLIPHLIRIKHVH